MIRFLSVGGVNFLTFPTLRARIDKLGLVRLTGQNADDFEANDNDSGKTNFFSLIPWVLFGKLPKLGDARVGDEVVLSSAGKNCVGYVVWRDGVYFYQVRRYRKHEKYGNRVVLLRRKVGEKKFSFFSSGKRGSTEEEIERALGMTYSLFMRTVFWAQSTALRRMTQLTDSDFKKLFDDLIGTDSYQGKLEKVKRRIDLLEKDCISLRAQLGDATTRLRTYREESRRHVVHNLDGRRMLKLNDLYESFYQLALEESRNSERWFNSVKLLQRERDSVCARLKETKLEISNTKKGLERQECGYCGQTLRGESSKTRLRESLGKIEFQLKHFERSKLRYDGKIKEVWKEYQEFRARWKRLKSQSDEYLQKFFFLVPKDWKVLGRAEILSRVRRNLESKEQRTRFGELIRLCERKVSEIQTRLKKKEKVVKWLHILERAYGPVGLRTLQLQSLSEPLNARAAKYSEFMSGGGLKVRFSTVSQNKDGTLRERYQIKVEKDRGVDFKLSGGGMVRRADLIATLAFENLRETMTNKRVNIKVYDEATDGLDSSGEQCFVDTLRKDKTPSRFFVSHKSLVGDHCFDRLWLIRRKGGVSNLEV